MHLRHTIDTGREREGGCDGTSTEWGQGKGSEVTFWALRRASPRASSDCTYSAARGTVVPWHGEGVSEGAAGERERERERERESEGTWTVAGW